MGMASRPAWAGRRASEESRERLRLILTLDRASLSPRMVDALKEDIRQVVSRYLVIDEENLEVNLESRHDRMALLITIPVVMVRRAHFPASGLAFPARL